MAESVDKEELDLADLLNSPKRRKFVIAYCENGGKITAAAESAGLKCPASQGSRMLKDVKVQEAIARHSAIMARVSGEPRDTIIDRIRNRARANASDIFLVNENTIAEFHAGGLKHPSELPEATQRCIKSIAFNQHGISKVEFYDASSADRDLANIMGLNQKDNEGLTPDDAASLLAAAFDRMDGTDAMNAESG